MSSTAHRVLPLLLLSILSLPLAVSALVRETPIAREILFARNATALSGEAKVVLDEAFGLLAPSPTATVVLRGFAAGESNGETLARRRAEAAAAYFATKGVSWSRMNVTVGGVDATAGRAAVPLRRVELTVILREEIPPPRLTLRVEPAAALKGDPIQITWTTEGADTVVLLPLGVVAPAGDRQVAAERSMAFTLVAFGPGGEAREVQGISVSEPPAPVVSIRADPAVVGLGDLVNLSWTSAHASEVEISGLGPVPSMGSRVVPVTDPTTFTATATGRGGSASAEAAVRISVPELPRIHFWIEPEVLPGGGKARLYWMSERAEAVRIDGIGTLLPLGRREIEVDATTTFVATALGRGGEVQASVTIEVPSLPPPAPVFEEVPPPPTRVDAPLSPEGPIVPMPEAAPTRAADEKSVEVAVLGDDGRFLESLSAEDFSVEEEGHVREILEVRFTPRSTPVATGLLLDRSSSMRSDIENLRRAARRFVRAKRESDRILLIAFGTHVEILSDFETDLARIQSRIEEISDGGQTALYDALWEGVTRMERVEEPRVLVVLTDGRDQVGVFNRAGSMRSLDEVIARARASRVTVFTVGLGSEIDGITLGRISRETGGAPYYTLQSEDLVAIYARLAAGLLEGTYRITYRSELGNHAAARVRSRLGRVLGAL